MNIEIDLKNTYPFETRSPDNTRFTFKSPVLNNNLVTITVTIEPAYSLFMKDFMNLAFGPEVDNSIDDFATVRHADLSKALSTVLFCGYKYLETNPDKFIGIDGSDFRRAYFYFRILQRNYGYLNQLFRIRGIKFFVRLIRGHDKNDYLAFDPKEVIAWSYKIDNAPLKNHKSLYNYFMLKMK